MANDFYNNPTKKTVIIFISLYVVSLILLLLAITDLFTTSLFSGSNTMILFLMAMSTYSLINLLRNYRKSKSKNTEL